MSLYLQQQRAGTRITALCSQWWVI